MNLINYIGLKLITIHLGGHTPVMLLPGINSVDDEELKLISAHPSFKALIKTGKLVVMANSKKLPDGKRTVEDMLEYIPKIFDVKLLKKIIAEDGRINVIEAAKTKLESIVGTKKPAMESEVVHFN